LQIHFLLAIFTSKTAKKCGLSERHPEKQGLKQLTPKELDALHDFQSAIQKNKD